MSVRSWIAAGLVLVCAAASARAETDVHRLANVPVLDNGRVKPMDSLARETVQFITNREAVPGDPAGKGETKYEPLNLLLSWHDNPTYWNDRPLIYVPNLQLRAKLHMQPDAKWIAPGDLHQDGDFTSWVRDLNARHAEAEKTGEQTSFTKLEDAAVDVSRRLSLYDAAADFRIVGLVPSTNAEQAWITPFDLQTFNAQQAHADLPASLAAVRDAWGDLQNAYRNGDQSAFDAAVNNVRAKVTAVSGPYADQARVDREVAYNGLKPFRIVWISYLFVVMALVATTLTKNKWLYAGAMAMLIAAIGIHIGAFAFRCSITGWAPVTNIYETVIWVALASALFATVLELIYRKRTLAIGGAVTALITSVIADVMPPEYGHQLRNLTPVLRSNYWLIIHVLTIVSSYAAFALAAVLGNIVLGQYMLKNRPQQAIRDNLQFTYRAVQIGVLLVAAGTILGGLWADVSWGRFWGWDPKEVWALIILLTYLALLHGRFAGWVGPFGLAAGSVLCFVTVLMSWYGVNFILGVGLHAYGFGAGGQAYVGTYVAAQLIYVAVARWVYARRQKGTASPAPVESSLSVAGVAAAH